MTALSSRYSDVKNNEFVFAKYFDLRRGYTTQRFVHLVSQRFKLCVAALRDQGPPQRTRENQLNVLIG